MPKNENIRRIKSSKSTLAVDGIKTGLRAKLSFTAPRTGLEPPPEEASRRRRSQENVANLYTREVENLDREKTTDIFPTVRKIVVEDTAAGDATTYYSDSTSEAKDSFKRTLTTGCVYTPPPSPAARSKEGSKGPTGFDPADSLIELDLIFSTLGKEDLFGMIKEQRRHIVFQERRIRDLEDHIDLLTARVMQMRPEILHGPAQKDPLKFRF